MAVPLSGRYEVLRLLGEGGSSHVHLVRDTLAGGQPFALKVLPAHLTDRAIEEFRKLCALSYPGIAAAHEIGLDPRDGSCYFTVEYLEGADFLSGLKESGQETQLHAVAQLVRTLSFLHDRGIVHRDLKPGNVLVRGQSSSLEVFLIDFGLATREVRPDEVAGSLPYLAPELFEGTAPGPASDLYSVGILLYQLWTGRLPFQAGTPIEWVRAHREEPVRFHDEDPVPNELRRLVIKLLEKDRARRYPDARTLLTDLSRMSSRPIPGETRSSLLGRIRSFPWELLAEGTGARFAADPGFTWVTASTAQGRAALSRELRIEAVQQGFLPIVVPFGHAQEMDPLEALLAQAAALQGEAAFLRGDYEAAVGALAERKVAVFLEELDTHLPDQETWLRVLLQQRLPIVATAARDPSTLALLKSLRRGAVRQEEPPRLVADELRRLAVPWMGVEFPQELLEYLHVGDGVEVPRVVEILSYLCSCGALDVHGPSLQLRLGSANLSAAAGDLLSIRKRRLELLDVSTRSLVEVLAVVDAPVDAATMKALMQDSWDGAPLADLEQQGLVRRRRRKGRIEWEVAGAETRDAVVSLLDPEALRELHRRAYAVLRSRVDAPERDRDVCRHRFRAEPDPESARRYARVADDLVSAGRFAEAGDIAAEVLRSVEVDAETVALARYVSGTALLNLGSTQEAVAELRRAQETCSSGELLQRIHLRLAKSLVQAGDLGEALAVLEDSGSDPATLPAEVLTQKAFVLYRHARLEEAELCCLQASERIDDEDFDTHLQLHNNLGLIYTQRTEADRARKEFRKAIQWANRAMQPLKRSVALYNLARVEDDCGQLERALELFRESAEIRSRYGDRQLGAVISVTVAQTFFDLGRVAESKSALQSALEQLEELGLDKQYRRNIANIQVQVALAEGELEVAATEAEVSRRIASQQKDRRGILLAEILRLEILIRREETAEARALLDDLRGQVEEVGSEELREYASAYALRLVCWLGEKEELAGLLQDLPGPSRSVKRRADQQEAQARALVCTGRYKEALTVLRPLEGLLSSTQMQGHLTLARALIYHASRAIQEARQPAHPSSRIPVPPILEPGHRLRRAEALYWVGLANSDPALLEDAVKLARQVRHQPLVKRIEEALMPLRSTRSSTPDLQEERLRSLEQLKEITKVINREIDGERLLRLVLDQAIEKTRAKRGFLILLRGNSISIPVARNMGSTDIENPEFAVSSSVARTVAQDGRAYLASDARTDERFKHASSISHLKLQSILCAPLRSHDHLIGAIYLDDPNRVDRFDSDDLQFVEDLSDHAAIALEKANLLRDNIRRQKELEQSKKEIERLNRELEKTVAAQARELIEVKESLRAMSLKYEYPAVITRSRVMQDVLRQVDQVTDSSYPVFLFGESGTGKELLAHSIHQNGPRRALPYWKINCASIPESLIESELFGHEKGAFTGADREKPGYFELADGGTLFLDEICDASLELQAKLLRATQLGEFFRVGGNELRKVDVRVISASNRNMEDEVARGAFREDLFYRLNVHHVRLPALRERREDIPLLIKHLQEKHAEKLGLRPLVYRGDAMALLMEYPWPGNVRELENCVIDLIVRLGDREQITPDDLSDKIRLPNLSAAGRRPESGKGLKQQLDEFEIQLLRRALHEHSGNRSRAAKDLGMSERNLYKKIQKYDLLGADKDPEDQGAPSPDRKASG